MTVQEAWEALAQVIDPELGIDIVELGLVYRVEVDEHVVSVLMTLTTPGCPLHDVIVQGAERALGRPGGPRVEVELTFDPPWNPERINAGGLRELGAPGAGG